MNLKKLIRENGKPDILIDNYNNRLNKGIAIWGVLDKITFDYNGIKKTHPSDILVLGGLASSDKSK